MYDQHDTRLDGVALGAAAAQCVARDRVRRELRRAVGALNTLGRPLTIQQHGILVARMEDALYGVGITALALSSCVIAAEEEEEREEREREEIERLASQIEPLLDFSTRVGLYVGQNDPNDPQDPNDPNAPSADRPRATRNKEKAA